MTDSRFQFFAPLSFFEKASESEGKRRRIAGIISTEKLDKQGEVVVQKGLDFGPFLKEGWFNDNHSKKTSDVLGYPDPNGVKRFQKGAELPDGTKADSNCTWAEGYLLDTPDADKIWNLGQALQKAGSSRRLGYSIEGNVEERTGPGNKVVAKARVRNVAITNCPVGEGTRLETLVKSFNDFEKGMSMVPSAAPPAGQGPQTGAGAGRVLASQSLEQDEKTPVLEDDADDDKELTKSAAMARIQRELGCSEEFAERAYGAICGMRNL